MSPDEMINVIQDIDTDSLDGKTPLLIEDESPDLTIPRLCEVLAAAEDLFDRGGPVRLVFDHEQGGFVAHPLTAKIVAYIAHQMSRPFRLKKKRDGTLIAVNVALPDRLAQTYLDLRGEWGLRHLVGIASAPLLGPNGTIHCHVGYHASTKMWCENVPDVRALVRERPTRADAEAALRRLRHFYRTLCFADAETTLVLDHEVLVVDIEKPPGADESAFLCGLLTAVCRPSLDHAPGLMLTGAHISGAGTGKGLAARCICMIAFGRHPGAITGGRNIHELEKRIASELISGGPVLLLDNINNQTLRSDLLASVLTESPARIRVLGESRTVALNTQAFIVLTGNALTVSEDLIRRFLEVSFDARVEHPEGRRFEIGLLAETERMRSELLAACLTIWRWGQLADRAEIPRGAPLGSFSRWTTWVRDPLLALGCKDPVARMAGAKNADIERVSIAALFAAWRERHQDRAIELSDLHPEIAALAVGEGGSRQALAAAVRRLVNVRMAGMMLTCGNAGGKWAINRYRLVLTDASAAGMGA